MANLIKIKRGAKAALPTLAAGELAFTTDTLDLFCGTGSANALVGGLNYIQSRLQNLVTNGNGLLQSNYNFSSFTFDPVETHGGAGSFLHTGGSMTALSTELIPVDPEKFYRLAVWAKAGDSDGSHYQSGNKQYFGLAPYDIDGNTILPHHYGKFSGSTDTTLAAQLNPGDATVTLTNATGWYNDSTFGYNRNFVWWPYTNAKGYTYPNYTYTRNLSYTLADFGTDGAWAAGGISGNVITLRAVWPGPTLPAGTPVRNMTLFGGFIYSTMNAVSVPNAWTRYEGYVGGYNTVGTSSTILFPYGTAYIKILALPNYTGTPADNYIRFSDIWLSEMSSRNLEAASATVPGVVTIGAQTFAGNKTFTGTITAAGFSGPMVNFTKFRAVCSGSQQNIATTATKVTFAGTETYDPDSAFDNATNHRFTAPAAGYYLMTAAIDFQSSNYPAMIMFYVNGSQYTASQAAGDPGSANPQHSVSMTDIIYLAANSYVEVYAKGLSGTVYAYTGFFAGHRLS